MRPLYEYMRGKPETVVEPFLLGKTPLECGDKLKEFVHGFEEGQAKDIILKNLEEYLEKNKRKRNLTKTCGVGVYFSVNNPEDRLLQNVLGEIERIGVFGDSGEFEPIEGKYITPGGKSCGNININIEVKSYEDLKKGEYEYKISDWVPTVIFQKTNHGNGYNELPAEDINIIRQKLYDCMKDTRYEILSRPVSDRLLNVSLYQFDVCLTAEYDNGKLKKLLKELQKDRRLQSFADRLESTSKGIAAYYASKRSGDYTGD